MNDLEIDQNEAMGRVVVPNAGPVPIQFVLEPWAEEVVIPASGSATIEYVGPNGGLMEIRVEPGLFILYGWPGSTFSVAINDGESDKT